MTTIVSVNFPKIYFSQSDDIIRPSNVTILEEKFDRSQLSIQKRKFLSELRGRADVQGKHMYQGASKAVEPKERKSIEKIFNKKILTQRTNQHAPYGLSTVDIEEYVIVIVCCRYNSVTVTTEPYVHFLDNSRSERFNSSIEAK